MMRKNLKESLSDAIKKNPNLGKPTSPKQPIKPTPMPFRPSMGTPKITPMPFRPGTARSKMTPLSDTLNSKVMDIAKREFPKPGTARPIPPMPKNTGIKMRTTLAPLSGSKTSGMAKKMAKSAVKGAAYSTTPGMSVAKKVMPKTAAAKIAGKIGKAAGTVGKGVKKVMGDAFTIKGAK